MGGKTHKFVSLITYISVGTHMAIIAEAIMETKRGSDYEDGFGLLSVRTYSTESICKHNGDFLYVDV